MSFRTKVRPAVKLLWPATLQLQCIPQVSSCIISSSAFAEAQTWWHLIATVLKCHQLSQITLFRLLPVPLSLPSNRHHWSNDDCLEAKRESYQVCFVQYCVQQLCTLQHTHLNRHNSCLLMRFSFSVVILCVTVCLC